MQRCVEPDVHRTSGRNQKTPQTGPLAHDHGGRTRASHEKAHVSCRERATVVRRRPHRPLRSDGEPIPRSDLDGPERLYLRLRGELERAQLIETAAQPQHAAVFDQDAAQVAGRIQRHRPTGGDRDGARPAGHLRDGNEVGHGGKWGNRAVGAASVVGPVGEYLPHTGAGFEQHRSAKHALGNVHSSMRLEQEVEVRPGLRGPGFLDPDIATFHLDRLAEPGSCSPVDGEAAQRGPRARAAGLTGWRSIGCRAFTNGVRPLRSHVSLVGARCHRQYHHHANQRSTGPNRKHVMLPSWNPYHRLDAPTGWTMTNRALPRSSGRFVA